ncbi:MAG TPA: D-aminoacylase [Terriglobales bacterium]|nr:D-aminoacylase [Terriglobales bacterium]
MIAAPALAMPERAAYDVVIRHGNVFDGDGAPPREMDVAILSGDIATIHPHIPGAGRIEIDARGLAVAPGFIDIHSHADGTLFEDPRAESVIRQGVTTVIAGQDGSSRAPVFQDDVRSANPVLGRAESLSQVFETINSLPSAINVASMVGLGTVRHAVIGDDDRPATEAELQRMTALVEEQIRFGACGASSGLEYVPSGFASAAELATLCRPLASRGLPYATHMRNEDDRLLESIDEAISVARAARCPLQISHLKTEGERNWHKLDAVFERLSQARDAGISVAFDRYPYIAFQTGLSNLFPKWSEDGGTGPFLGRLSNADLGEKLRSAVKEKVALIGGWDNVLISSVSSEAERGAENQRLGSYARALGREPYDVAVSLLINSHADVGMVCFAMSERNLERFLAHPLAMICSDGGAVAIEDATREGHPHPRTLGTFPRVLGVYAREKRVLTLPQAIYKMTGFPASRVKLSDRGRLAPRFAADVVIFDPATVADRASFANPFQYPVGIRTVLVNGKPAILDGERRQARDGRALRPSTYMIPEQKKS